MSFSQSYNFDDLETYKDVFDNVHDLVHIIEPDGKIVYVNNSWRKLLGNTIEVIKNSTIFSFVAPEDADRFSKIHKAWIHPLIQILASRPNTKLCAEIRVEDNGIGFPQQYADRILTSMK